MKIAIPDLISNSYFPAIAAVELGYFADEGLNLELELIYPVSKAYEALRQDELMFVAGAAHAVPRAFPEWRGAKLLGALSQYMYWFLVLRSDLGVARGDVNAVKGLSIGAAPDVDLGIRRLLIDSGLDPEADDIRIGPVPGAGDTGVSFGVQAAKALEDGKLDGFWANGIGAETAVRKGVGTIVLDVRRGDGPPAARYYTFPALVATDVTIQQKPDFAKAALKALMKTQRALIADMELATQVGQKVFPAYEASLIADVVSRDVDFYSPAIPQDVVERLVRFECDMGLISGPVSYDQVIASNMIEHWT